MVSPVPGYKVTTPYGKPGAWAAGYHTGDDYACPKGTPVVAAAAGTVIRAAWDESYGNYVEVETGSIRHRYCHLEDAFVWAGLHVDAGQMLGAAGSTGNSTGPHCHYEERGPDWGYWDHRPPVFNHQTEPEPEPEPEIEPPAREQDMILIKQSGSDHIYLAGVAGLALIHGPEDLNQIATALANPGFIATVGQGTLDQIALGGD